MKPPKVVSFGDTVYLEGIRECLCCDSLVPYLLPPLSFAWWPVLCIKCDPRFAHRAQEAETVGPLSVHIFEYFEDFI